MSSINTEIEKYTGLISPLVREIVDYLPKVSVIYERDLWREQVIDKIAKIKEPLVMQWYISEYGLKEKAALYFRRDIKEILALSNKSECFLYDLTAWAALRNPEKRLDAFNNNVVIINDFAIQKLRCWKSSDFFDWLINERSQKVIAYFRERILQPGNFFYKVSEKYSDSGIKVRQVCDGILQKCPVLESDYEKDTSKEYGPIQYLEGLYLTWRLVELRIKDSDEINIIFDLPNNEWKYYQDPEESFANDVEFFLRDKFGEKLKGKKINVYFYTYKFGKDQDVDRPYNEGRVIIKTIQRSDFLKGE